MTTKRLHAPDRKVVLLTYKANITGTSPPLPPTTPPPPTRGSVVIFPLNHSFHRRHTLRRRQRCPPLPTAGARRSPRHPPVAYVGALQARLVSERSRKRCACGGVGTPRCTWRFPGAPGVVLFSKKCTCQVRLCISRCTWGSPGAPGDLQVHPRI